MFGGGGVGAGGCDGGWGSRAGPLCCKPLVGEKLFGEHYNANQPREKKKKRGRQPGERDLNM